jgi:hypothetical protein
VVIRSNDYELKTAKTKKAEQFLLMGDPAFIIIPARYF